MDNKKVFAIVAIALLVAVGVGAVVVLSDKDESTADFKDMRDRVVDVPDDVDSIICLGACSLRLVTYFDAVDKVVAIEKMDKNNSLNPYMAANPELLKLDIVSSDSPETIISKNPSVVISSTIDKAKLDDLQKTLGIPVVAINADLEPDSENMEKFCDQFKMLGKLFDEKDRANDLVEGIKAIFSDLNKRAGNVVNPVDAYACGMNFYGVGSVPFLKTTGDYLPFGCTGVKNIMVSNPAPPGKQPYETTIEKVVAGDPNYIFVDPAGKAACIKYCEDNKTVLNSVYAIANGEVYSTLMYKSYGTNWENQLINIYYVGSTVYPDLYKDVNMNDKALEIWKLFFQKDVDYEIMTQQGDFGSITL